MKKTLSILLVLIMLISAMPMSAFAESADQPRLVVNRAYAFSGNTVSVDIMLENNPGIISAKLSVAFDDSMTLISAQSGDAFAELNYVPPRQLTVGESITSYCNFVWNASDIADEDITDGRVLTLTFKMSNEVDVGEVYNITVSSRDIDVVDKNMNFVDLDIAEGEVVIVDFTPGDVDNDGKISMIDVVMLSRYIVDDCKYDPEGYAINLCERAADVNNDGYVSMFDVVMMNRYIVDNCTTDPEGYNITLQYAYRRASGVEIVLDGDTEPMTSLELDLDEVVNLSAIIYPSNALNKKLRWESSDPDVATVSQTGTVTALAAGQTTISVTVLDGSGVTAECEVTVGPPRISSITLSDDSITINSGCHYMLSATVMPEDSIQSAIEWSSSDPYVAEVSQDGVVFGLNPGTAVITVRATDGGEEPEAYCTVTVLRTYVEEIILNETEKVIYPGKSFTLSAEVIPEYATESEVVWSTSDEAIATVTSNGVVKGIASGTAIITATAADGSGAMATCKVTVGTYVSNIIVTSPVDKDSSWYVGKTGKLEALVMPYDATNREVTWSSSNTKYATVDSDGNVKALYKTSGGLSVSSVTITATANDGSGVKGTYKITIAEYKAVSSIAFDANVPTEMFVNEAASFKATVSPDAASERKINYTTSDPNIATVDENGNVRALRGGTVVITAASAFSPDIKVSTTITVVDVSIELNFSYKRDFYTVGAQAYPYCVTTPDTALQKLGNRFESEDESVACFDPIEYNSQRYAILNFVGPGKTRVRAVTAGNEAVSEWIDVEVRELITDKDFFQNASIGNTYEVEAYIFNGEKLPIINEETGSLEIEPDLGEYEQYFNVSFENGKFIVSVINDLPDGGAYVNFRTPDGRMSKKVWFIRDEYNVPSGTKEQLLDSFKNYSLSANNIKSASQSINVNYNDVTVDNDNSKTDANVKCKDVLGKTIEMSLRDYISLMGSDVDADEIMAELQPEVLINDLYGTPTSEKNQISSGSKEIQPIINVSAADVKSVTVINDDHRSTYKMKLDLKDMTGYTPLDNVKTSAYGKTMNVIDKAYMDSYAASISQADDSVESSLDYGEIEQKYTGGYVIYTIDKITNKIIESEYHYNSAMKIDNAKLNMSSTVSDTGIGTGGVTMVEKVTAYFTMNVETTKKYTAITYR